MRTDPVVASDAPAPRPIADYGLLGDTRTAALVSSDGAIDWFCAPRFDDVPVFGRLVGGQDAGTFAAGPAPPAALVDRRYRGESATLVTTWEVGPGRLTLTEGMVGEVAGRLLPPTMLVRRLSAEGCPVIAKVHFEPRRGELHVRPRVRRRFDNGLLCEWGSLALSLTCDTELGIEPGRPTLVTVRPGQPVTLVLGTLVTEDPDRARVAGFFIHLVVGQGFALGYTAVFASLHRATWWLGALLGMLHVAIALLALLPLLPGVHPRMASVRAGPSSTAVLEPPGLLALNYGIQTPVVAVVAHVLYGTMLGTLLGVR